MRAAACILVVGSVSCGGCGQSPLAQARDQIALIDLRPHMLDDAEVLQLYPTDGECASLAGAEASIDGKLMELRDTMGFESGIEACIENECRRRCTRGYWKTFPRGSRPDDRADSELVIFDRGDQWKMKMPHLYARRRLTVVTAGPVRVGEDLKLSWSPDTDVGAVSEVAISAPDAGYPAEELDAGRWPIQYDAGRFTFRVPNGLTPGEYKLWDVQARVNATCDHGIECYARAAGEVELCMSDGGCAPYEWSVPFTVSP